MNMTKNTNLIHNFNFYVIRSPFIKKRNDKARKQWQKQQQQQSSFISLTQTGKVSKATQSQMFMLAYLIFALFFVRFPVFFRSYRLINFHTYISSLRGAASEKFHFKMSKKLFIAFSSPSPPSLAYQLKLHTWFDTLIFPITATTTVTTAVTAGENNNNNRNCNISIRNFIGLTCEAELALCARFRCSLLICQWLIFTFIANICFKFSFTFFRSLFGRMNLDPIGLVDAIELFDVDFISTPTNFQPQNVHRIILCALHIWYHMFRLREPNRQKSCPFLFHFQWCYFQKILFFMLLHPSIWISIYYNVYRAPALFQSVCVKRTKDRKKIKIKNRDGIKIHTTYKTKYFNFESESKKTQPEFVPFWPFSF